MAKSRTNIAQTIHVPWVDDSALAWLARIPGTETETSPEELHFFACRVSGGLLILSPQGPDIPDALWKRIFNLVGKDLALLARITPPASTVTKDFEQAVKKLDANKVAGHRVRVDGVTASLIANPVRDLTPDWWHGIVPLVEQAPTRGTCDQPM